MHNSVDFRRQFLIFDDIAVFSKAVEVGMGFTFDFASLTTLDANSILYSDKHLILNIKLPNAEEYDNLLYLTEREAFLFTKKAPNFATSTAYADLIQLPFGRSTVLTFLTIKEAFFSYKNKLEDLAKRTDDLENNIEIAKCDELASEFSRTREGLERFRELVIDLQDSGFKEFEISYIHSDYKKLIAETQSLLNEYRSLSNIMRDLGQIKRHKEYFAKIDKLNTSVKRLTVIIITLWLAFVISQLGMYFALAPKMIWIYPIVLTAEIITIAGWVIILSRKIH